MRLISIFFLVFFIETASAQSITVSGSWNPAINAKAITEAGNDYASGYAIESAANQSSINLTLGGGFFNILFNAWRVDVQRSDILWHSSLVLETRRTSNGTGSFLGSIANGTAYQRVNTNAQSFFDGTGSYNNVNIQYRISGMSILTPVNTYSTSVIFTLIDN